MYYGPNYVGTVELSGELDRMEGSVRMLVIHAAWVFGMVYLPAQEAVWLRAWFVCGVCTVILSGYLTARRNPRTSFLRELFFGLSLPSGSGVFMEMLFWPLAILRGLLGRSYRDELHNEFIVDLLSGQRGTGISHDTILDYAAGRIATVDACGRNVERSLEEFSETARVACRAGALGAALVSTPVGASAQKFDTGILPRPPARPVPATSQPAFKATLAVGPQHGYLAKRISRNIYAGWMLWSEIDVSHSSGVFLNLWDSQLVGESKPRAWNGDELDVTLGWRGSVASDYKLRLSASLLNLSPLDRWWDGDVAVEELMLSRSWSLGENGNQTIKPELRLGWISNTEDFGGGVLLFLPSVAHELQKPFGIRHLSFSEQVTLAHDDGFNRPKNSSHGWFIRFDGTLNWKLNRRMSLALPAVSLQAPVVKPHDGRDKPEITFGSMLKVSF